MYALLIAIAAMIGITIYGSCSADGDFWGFDEEYASTKNTRAEKTDMSEYLTLSTSDPFKYTEEDWNIIGKAIMRVTIKYEDGLSHVQETKGTELNMSKELFSFIKQGFEDGNKLIQEKKHGLSKIKKQIVRRKTRDVEGNIHICTGNDCVGHSIASYLGLNIEYVNNTIHAKYHDYPDSIVKYAQLEPTLNLFRPFVRQSKFFPDNVTPPCATPGILLIPDHAVYALSTSPNSSGYVISCYDDQRKEWPLYTTPVNQCAPAPESVSWALFGYYKI